MKYKTGIVIKISILITIIIFVILNIGLIDHVWKCLGLNLPDGLMVGCALTGWKQQFMAILIYLCILLSYIIPAYFLVKGFLYLLSKISKGQKSK